MRCIKCWIIIVLWVAIILTMGCGAHQGGVPKYVEAAFCATVTGELEGVEFEASIAVADGEGLRDVELEFFAPKTLKGVRVTRRGGEVEVSLGEMTMQADVQGWLCAAEMLFPSRQASITAQEWEGETATLAVRSELGVYTLKINAATGFPVAAEMQSPRRIMFKVTSFSTASGE